MKKRKSSRLKNLLSGEIINVHLTTDHPDSSYGIPVWVDKEGRSYGQLGDLIFGYIFLPDENEEETK